MLYIDLIKVLKTQHNHCLHNSLSFRSFSQATIIAAATKTLMIEEFKIHPGQRYRSHVTDLILLIESLEMITVGVNLILLNQSE